MCLSGCVEDPRCRAVNYDVRQKDCYLLQNERRVQGTRTGRTNRKHPKLFDFQSMMRTLIIMRWHVKWERASDLDCINEPFLLLLKKLWRSFTHTIFKVWPTFSPDHRHLQHVHIGTWDECQQACQRVSFFLSQKKHARFWCSWTDKLEITLYWIDNVYCTIQ